MKKLVKEQTTSNYEYNSENVCIGEVKQKSAWYHYDSEEEKMYHKAIMESMGYTDSGQVREDISGNLFAEPNYVWVGVYYKTEGKHKK